MSRFFLLLLMLGCLVGFVSAQKVVECPSIVVQGPDRVPALFLQGKNAEAEKDFNRAVAMAPRLRAEIDANIKLIVAGGSSGTPIK